MDKIKQINQFIGIDVSKKTIDICFLTEEKELYFQVPNHKKGFKSLLSSLKKEGKLILSNALFCVEQTGEYSSPILFFLNELSTNVWLEMPIRIKQSSGVNRLKTDKTDAKIIAQYAMRFKDKFVPWVAPRKQIIQLKKLYALREKIVQSMVRYKSSTSDIDFTQDPEVKNIQKNIYRRVLNELKKEKELIEKHIKEIINLDIELKRLFEIVCSVSGVGFVSAIDIIINTNEFRNIKCAKKYACYSGIAPFEQSSGTALYKSKVSHLANKQAKKALHMGAMSAVATSGELQSYYYRKLAEGKPKMLALNAVRNKIIQRVFSCVKRNELYQRDYRLSA